MAVDGTVSAASRRPDWYLPPDGYLWDPWFHRVGDTIHLFHLFQGAGRRPYHGPAQPRDHPVIAHATWSAVDGWTAIGTAIDYTGASYDAQRIHTGCVVERAQGFSLLYSGSNRCVCLAESDSLSEWSKAGRNPVARPDPTRYLARWRDPWVAVEELDERYTMLIAAQQATAGPQPVGVVAVAYSTDLVHWHQDAPLRTPPWFRWMEVPELHEIDGSWYLLFATRAIWITADGRAALRDRGLLPLDGAYALVASSWQGPYEGILFLSGDVPPAYTTRLVKRSPTEWWLWSHVEHDGEGGVIFGLQPPRLVETTAPGGLRVR
jgi:sucrose-6-phosphate hydrolase SacC (GH32 family)